MQIANIVVKNSQDVDVTYVASRPQGGESSPALWIVKTGSRNSQTRLECLVRRSGSNIGYKTSLKLVVPLMDAIDPTKKISNVIFDLTVTSPDIISDAMASDVATQWKAILADPGIQTILSNQEPAL